MSSDDEDDIASNFGEIPEEDEDEVDEMDQSNEDEDDDDDDDGGWVQGGSVDEIRKLMMGKNAGEDEDEDEEEESNGKNTIELVWIKPDEALDLDKRKVFEIDPKCIVSMPREARENPFRISVEQYATMTNSKGRNRMITQFQSNYDSPIPMARLVCMLDCADEGNVAFLLCKMTSLSNGQYLCLHLGPRFDKILTDATEEHTGYDMSQKENWDSDAYSGGEDGLEGP